MKRVAPKQKKDELGRKLCRNCESPVGKGLRSYCSRKCREEFAVAYFPSSSRYHVFKRDQGLCAKCGCDTEKLRRILKWMRKYAGWKESYELARELGFNGGLTAGSFWQADHIEECARGGWGKGIENFRTLCTPCHKAETARLVRELAERRRFAGGLFDARRDAERFEKEQVSQ